MLPACWSCDYRLTRSELVCGSCDKIQPADPERDHFQLLGLGAARFDVNPGELEKRYKTLQFRLHPDRNVATVAAEERQHAADQASALNAAYRVLRSPLARAKYLLRLTRSEGAHAGGGGGGVPEEEVEESTIHGTIDNPELLMAVMEAREEVEGAEGDVPTLRKLLAANAQRQAALVEQLSAAFAAGDRQRAVQLTAELTYWDTLERTIVDML